MPQKLPQAAALVPGSKSIATEEVFSEARDLPRDKELVEHSTSHDLSGSLKSEESSKCAICQKNLGREGVKELQCGHIFHQTGLDRWAIENPQDGCGKPIHELCLNRWLHGSTTYICPACSTDYFQWHQEQLSDDIDLEAHEHDALTHLTDHEGQGQAHLLRDSSAFSSLVSSRKRMREYASENERVGLSLASSSHANKQRDRADPTREDHDRDGSDENAA
ncbi:uncharacterized protein PGTG_11322 [Puccinia graminis f. sp. tritici CRL 75-36-700-3]|uniref:RING-type domain-containing protein n=1 Tax=Puccinia graminis f. sp. tritici (strain CRL 75-36-700-3 / race SCCL) TaxID=418459 RepID=E3KLH8_PUCGT|nr:uncharacterized protein PGTG_11322 [Puccinia graminis f. sp. tritici CRL 75-36-700-3]EFP85153.2 hypothetical protein PGTG_11322 [Puccinia graminis f. sp. tritici CRL 75-36-700-3]